MDAGESFQQPGDRHRPLSHAAHHEGIFRPPAQCLADRLSGEPKPHRPGRLVAASPHRRPAAQGICQISRHAGDHAVLAMMLWLRSALFLVWFLALTTILSLIFLPVLLLPRRATVWLARLWSRLTLWGLQHIAGIGFEIRG